MTADPYVELSFTLIVLEDKEKVQHVPLDQLADLVLCVDNKLREERPWEATELAVKSMPMVYVQGSDSAIRVLASFLLGAHSDQVIELTLLSVLDSAKRASELIKDETVYWKFHR
jgi:hypothetical protein